MGERSTGGREVGEFHTLVCPCDLLAIFFFAGALLGSSFPRFEGAVLEFSINESKSVLGCLGADVGD